MELQDTTTSSDSTLNEHARPRATSHVNGITDIYAQIIGKNSSGGQSTSSIQQLIESDDEDKECAYENVCSPVVHPNTSPTSCKRFPTGKHEEDLVYCIANPVNDDLVEVENELYGT